MINKSNPAGASAVPAPCVAETKRMFLEVSRGLTKFPHRPVRSGRFLIGSGAGCDLRLGGVDIPPLHSIMLRENDCVSLESVAASPALRINDLPVETAVLRDGDRITIGSFEFRARFIDADGDALEEVEGPGFIAGENSQSPASDDGNETRLEKLSTEELIDLIDREQKMVDEFETRRNLGGDALLDAVMRRAKAADEQPLKRSPDELDESLIRGLERVVGQLNHYAAELEERAERVARRTARNSEHASDAFDVQRQLTERLESLLQRVSQNAAGHTLNPLSAA